MLRAEEALEEAFGHGVRVRATKKGLRAELQFDDVGELLEFARPRASRPLELSAG